MSCAEAGSDPRPSPAEIVMMAAVKSSLRKLTFERFMVTPILSDPQR